MVDARAHVEERENAASDKPSRRPACAVRASIVPAEPDISQLRSPTAKASQQLASKV
jgi:hypothetical protein